MTDDPYQVSQTDAREERRRGSIGTLRWLFLILAFAVLAGLGLLGILVWSYRSLGT